MPSVSPRILALAWSATLSLVAAAHAQPAIGPRTPAAWEPGAGALPRTWTRVVRSRVTGRSYQISVALPDGYAGTTAAYPVLYAVDANMQFGTVVEAARYMAMTGQGPALIVVGVGYPGREIGSAVVPRLLDLSPWPDSAFIAGAAPRLAKYGAPEGTGGGPAFLRFLQAEVIPLVEAEYRTVPTDRAIYGHSLGGLFAVYALLAGDGTFQRFIVGSPDLPWAARSAFAAESAFAATHRRLPGRLFVSAGLLERPAMLEGVRALLGVLEARKYDGLTWESHLFEEETHVSVIPATISRGLRSVYRK
jgi:uncharacterized protein